MSDPANEVDREAVLRRFKTITGATEEGARAALENSSWHLEVALDRYYNTVEQIDDDDDELEVMSIPPDDTEEIVESPSAPNLQSAPSAQKKVEKARFGTLSELMKVTEATDSSEEEEGQAYYAGGSQHSGQQVLGPPSRKKKKDIISDILKSAQRIGAEVIDTTKPSSGGSRELFTGTGYRLGQTENDSEVLPSASSTNAENTTVVLKLWHDGFNVDDGPLRSYDDPGNKEFLDSVREGLIPQELTRGLGNQILHLDLQDHHDERYVPNMTSRKIKPFTGAGHVLGSPAPPVVGTQESQTADGGGQSREVKLDPNEPVVNIAIRLASGSRLTGRFNPSHTIADVRTYIANNRPEYAQRSYTLRTTLPAVDLHDHQTLDELKLNNSVITMLLH